MCGGEKGKDKAKLTQEDGTAITIGDSGQVFWDDDGYDDQSIIPVGCRFDPSDRDLVAFYLRRKAAGRMPPNHDFIPTLQLYVAGAEPWLIHPAVADSPASSSQIAFFFPRDSTDWFYCFTHTTPRGPGSCRSAGSGTWLCNGKDMEIHGARGQILGYKNTFAFKKPGGAKWVSTSWVMHEFKLHSKKEGKKSGGGGPVGEEELVLCRIRCTKILVREEDESTSRKRQRMIGGPEEDGESFCSIVVSGNPEGNCAAEGTADPHIDVGTGGVPMAWTAPAPFQDSNFADAAPGVASQLSLGNPDRGAGGVPMACRDPALLQDCDLARDITPSVPSQHCPGDLGGQFAFQGPSGDCSDLPSSSMDDPAILFGGGICNGVDWEGDDLDSMVVQQEENGQWMLTLNTGQEHRSFSVDSWVADPSIQASGCTADAVVSPAVTATLGSTSSGPCDLSPQGSLPSSEFTMPSTVGEDSWQLGDIVDLESMGIRQDDNGKWDLLKEVELQENVSVYGIAGDSEPEAAPSIARDADTEFLGFAEHGQLDLDQEAHFMDPANLFDCDVQNWFH